MLNYEQQLDRIGRLTAPAIGQGMDGLLLKPGMVGLDAGCGIGRHTFMLSQKVQPGGKAVGLDISDKFLDIARQSDEAKELGSGVEFKQGSILDLPFKDNSFDFLWCADVLWAGPGLPVQDPVKALQELARVVKPGGKVAVAFWTQQALYPGHPVFEARFNLGFSEGAPYFAGALPEQHCMRALGWMEKAKLADRQAQNCVTSIQGPLSEEKKESLHAVLHMFAEVFRSKISKSDMELFEILSSMDSEESILNLPDYYGYIVYTIFSGTKE